MKSIFEYYEDYSSPFAQLRDVDGINEAAINVTEIKNWVSQNYYILGSGKKNKPLPKKCISVDKATGDVTISKLNEVSHRTMVYLNHDSNTFAKGFKIAKIEGSLVISSNDSREFKGKVIEVTDGVFYSFCDKMVSLKNSPKIITGTLGVTFCESLVSLACSTESVDKIRLNELKRLEDLSGLPKTITEEIEIQECPMLKSYGDLPDEYKSKINFVGLKNNENPIEKWEKTLMQTNVKSGGGSLLDLVDGGETEGTVTYVKHDVAKLLMDNCGWSFGEEDIRLISNPESDKGPVEVEIHTEGVPDNINYQHQRQNLKLSKSTNLKALVGKVKIVNYVDNFDIDEAAPDLTDFKKVFINANPWRLRVSENKAIKDLSCLKPIEDVPFRRIYIGECPNITSLKVCPKVVSLHIYIEKCPRFKEFGCQLPDIVEWVRVIHCPNFNNLKGIAKNMKGLECYATGIKSFEGGIEKLINLDAHNCQNLTSFKGLPEDVEYVIVTKCTNLKSLTGIPKVIRNLSIKGTQLGPFKNKRDLAAYCEIQGTLSK